VSCIELNVCSQEIKNRKELTSESLEKLEAIVMDSAKAQVGTAIILKLSVVIH
jgi:hypothetical protein